MAAEQTRDPSALDSLLMVLRTPALRLPLPTLRYTRISGVFFYGTVDVAEGTIRAQTSAALGSSYQTFSGFQPWFDACHVPGQSKGTRHSPYEAGRCDAFFNWT
jgi:hypothetical protein